VLWAITEDLRKLIRVKAQVDGGRPFSSVTRENQIWSSREPEFEAALRRIDSETLDAALARAGEIDRLSKGLRAPQTDSDPWLELTDLALSLAH
jgi:DNA polymerase-3 subunit delta